jgi:hypothetical protein
MPECLFIPTPRYANIKSTKPLKLFLRSHIHYLQRSIHQLNHMSWFECFGVYIVNIMGMEDARFRAIQNGLFAGRISKAKAPPADIELADTRIIIMKRGVVIYLGSLLGAQTMAILSGIITWYPTCVCRSRLLIKHVCVGCV